MRESTVSPSPALARARSRGARPAAATRRCARDRAVGADDVRSGLGAGAYAYDESGRRYIDYVMAYGPLLFGHTHRGADVESRRARARRLRLGKHASGRNPSRRTRSRARAVDAAAALRHDRHGSGDERGSGRARLYAPQRRAQVRWQLSRSLRSRAARRRRLRAYASAGEAGIPEGVVRDVAVARYNDLSNVDELLRGRERRPCRHRRRTDRRQHGIRAAACQAS